MRAAKELRFAAAGMRQENTTLTLDSGSSPTVETPIPASPMTQVRTPLPDLPSLTTPSRSSTPDMVADASPRRSPDSSPARGCASPTSSHTVDRRSPLHPASPSGSSESTFCGFSPAPASDSDEEEKSGFSPSAAQHLTDTHDCKSLNAANGLRFVAEVWQESRHTSGVSQGKNKTLHQRHAALPPSKNKTPKPTSRRTPPKIPQLITGRSHRPPPASPRRLRRPVSVNVRCAHVKRERMCIPRRGSSGDQPTGPPAPPQPGFPPRCRSPAPPANGRGTRFSPAGSQPGQG